MELPDYLQTYLRLQKIGLTMWQDFDRRPRFNHKERLICLISGKEKFRLINAIYKQNMYSGVYEDLSPLETPINLFETDIDRINRYHMMRLEYLFEATLEAGSCIYIP